MDPHTRDLIWRASGRTLDREKEAELCMAVDEAAERAEEIMDNGNGEGRIDIETFARVVWHNPDAATWIYLFAPESWLPRGRLLEEALALELAYASVETVEASVETAEASVETVEVAESMALFWDLDRRLAERLLDFLNA
jgi:hypothetical protein